MLIEAHIQVLNKSRLQESFSANGDEYSGFC